MLPSSFSSSFQLRISRRRLSYLSHRNHLGRGLSWMGISRADSLGLCPRLRPQIWHVWRSLKALQREFPVAKQQTHMSCADAETRRQRISSGFFLEHSRHFHSRLWKAGNAERASQIAWATGQWFSQGQIDSKLSLNYKMETDKQIKEAERPVILIPYMIYVAQKVTMDQKTIKSWKLRINIIPNSPSERS